MKKVERKELDSQDMLHDKLLTAIRMDSETEAKKLLTELGKEFDYIRLLCALLRYATQHALMLKPEDSQDLYDNCQRLIQMMRAESEGKVA